MKRNKLFLYSLTSLAVIASSAVSAQEIATAPTLEGGFEAMIGGFLAVPSTDSTAYYTNSSDPESPTVNSSALTTDGQYEVGIQAAIGYVFPETANAIELSWRNYDSSANNSDSFLVTGDFDEILVNGDQKNSYEDWDLMISQFLDIGTHVQMRFLGGISYLSDLDQTNKSTTNGINLGGGACALSQPACSTSTNDYQEFDSSYRGLGPRVGIDGRYDFGDDIEGFGIVGGFSVAYFLGNLDTSSYRSETETVTNDTGTIVDTEFVSAHSNTNTNSNHAVTNLRANLGVDYVYFFDNEELSTLGLELGYEVDTYIDGVGQSYGNPGVQAGQTLYTSNVTFSGPYLNLKGAF
ncbi:MAG: Lpg1974 family pore-forming outer membrane protein [Legionellales bacterium]|jgi:hypothetical protein